MKNLLIFTACVFSLFAYRPSCAQDFFSNYKKSAYFLKKDIDSCKLFSIAALESTNKPNQKSAVYNLLGLASHASADYSSSISYYTRALQLCEEEEARANIMSNLSNAYRYNNDLKKARERVLKSIQHKKKTDKNLFAQFGILASIYSKEQKRDSALYYYSLARIEAEKRKDKAAKIAELERCLGDLYMTTSSALALRHYMLAQTNLNKYIQSGGGVLADDRAQLSAKIAQALRISKPRRAAEMLDSLCNNRVLSKLTAYTQADILQQRAAMYTQEKNEKGLFRIHSKLDSILASPSARTKSAKDLNKFLEARASIERELKSIATTSSAKANNLSYLVIILFPVACLLLYIVYYLRKMHTEQQASSARIIQQNENTIQQLEQASTERSDYASKLERKLQRIGGKIDQKFLAAIMQNQIERNALDYIAELASSSPNPLTLLRVINQEAQNLQSINTAFAYFMQRFPEFYIKLNNAAQDLDIELDSKQKRFMLLLAAQAANMGVENEFLQGFFGYKPEGLKTAKRNIARLFNKNNNESFNKFLLDLLR